MPFKISVSTVLTTIILLACVVRFVGLEISPPGFFYDEATGAAHSMCYQQTGYDLFGQRGAFSQVDFGGIQSAPFIVGGALWTSVFGTDVAGFRSFVAFVGVLAVLAIYMLARLLTEDRTYALWAAAVAACLPWAFQFSRISWDAPVGVTLLLWGMVLAYLKRSSGPTEYAAWAAWIGAGVLLTLASYTYSPLRLQALGLVVLMPLLPWRPRLVILAIFVLGNINTLLAYQDPAFASRAQLLALTSDDSRNPFAGASVFGLLMAYVSQMGEHFSLTFLLAPGDFNLRHSIQTHGTLDWLSFGGLLIGLALLLSNLPKLRVMDPRHLSLFAVCVIGILTGLSPSALTWDSIPHALRAIGAWPFFALLSAWGLHQLLQARTAQLLGCACMAGLFLWYLYSYFALFPGISRWWFDADIVDQIRATGEFPDHYFHVARAYHQMETLGQSCVAVRQALGVQP